MRTGSLRDGGFLHNIVNQEIGDSLVSQKYLFKTNKTILASPLHTRQEASPDRVLVTTLLTAAWMFIFIHM